MALMRPHRGGTQNGEIPRRPDPILPRARHGEAGPNFAKGDALGGRTHFHRGCDRGQCNKPRETEFLMKIGGITALVCASTLQAAAALGRDYGVWEVGDCGDSGLGTLWASEAPPPPCVVLVEIGGITALVCCGFASAFHTLN